MSEFIYITDEYPNPPKRINIREARDIGILMEPSSKKSIKEYFKNVLKRKEQKGMKFKVGDRVRINKPGSYYNNMVAVITKDNYESITDKLGYQIRIGEYKYPLGCVWFDKDLELVERAAFTKSDLKDGMVVKFRDSDTRILLNGHLMDKNSVIDLCRYTDDLRHPSFDPMTIDKVYISHAEFGNNYFEDRYLELIWERKEEPDYKEMTVAEIEKKLGYKVKIVDGE